MAIEDSGIASFGTQIQVLTNPGAGTPVFVTVAGVGDIDGPSLEIDEIETTSHSTGIPIKTFLASLIDPGELSFPLFWNPADPTQNPASPYSMEKLFYDRKTTDWRLVATDSAKTTRQFKGFVKSLAEEYPVSGVVTKNAAIRISGAMTYVLADVTLTPTENLLETAAGGPKTVTVASTDTKPWYPISDVAWITVNTPTAPVTGAGSVGYTVAANTDTAARTGKLYIGSKTFTVTQAGTP